MKSSGFGQSWGGQAGSGRGDERQGIGEKGRTTTLWLGDQREDGHTLGYAEHGLGRMVVGEGRSSMSWASSGFISHSLNPAKTA